MLAVWYAQLIVRVIGRSAGPGSAAANVGQDPKALAAMLRYSVHLVVELGVKSMKLALASRTRVAR